MRPFCLGPKPSPPVLLISLIITFKPLNAAISFKGQNMSGDLVKKPTIMANDHSASGEIKQSFL